MSAVLLAMAYDALTPMANKKKPNFFIISIPSQKEKLHKDGRLFQPAGRQDLARAALVDANVEIDEAQMAEATGNIEAFAHADAAFGFAVHRCRHRRARDAQADGKQENSQFFIHCQSNQINNQEKSARITWQLTTPAAPG
ncbi:hypothetical protein [Janthinobacterium violaceinigrum]|uniref:Uncharacterized protein n=1 Tax=Janthinobacterium violaceinigrum TaxID=2654252 RepID=A0A6I1HPR5_9BURK|nr:hypothetical protein [Janthinobacterium violaceinigrum]KAB8058929.1 hypothetical protein GCN75_27195 [Janthinobacterium violaceinigrum]